MRRLVGIGAGMAMLLLAMPVPAQGAIEKAVFTVDVDGIYSRLQNTYGPPFAPGADLDGDGFPDATQDNVLLFLEIAGNDGHPEHDELHDAWIDNFILARNIIREQTALDFAVIDDLCAILALFLAIDGPGMEDFWEDFWENELGITDPDFHGLSWVHSDVFDGDHDHDHDDDHDHDHDHGEAIAHGGYFHVGGQLFLRIPDPVDTGAPIQWYKDGQPLSDYLGLRLGTQSRTLEFYYLEESDTGTYWATYDDGTKAPTTFGPVSIYVVPVGSTPVAGLAGLGALLIALGAGGMAAHRRIRK